MTETLEFPELSPASAATTALAAQDLTAVALARFGDWRPQVDALAKKYRNVVFDVTLAKGLQAAKAARHEVRQVRFNAANISKAAKSELAKVSKAIGEEEKLIEQAVREIEDPIDNLIEQREREIELQRQAAQRAEEERRSKHAAGIRTILSYTQMAVGLPAEQIANGIAIIEAMSIGEEWEEFRAEAQAARDSTLQALRDLHARTQETEAEAARLAAERAELDRRAAAIRELEAEAHRRAIERQPVQALQPIDVEAPTPVPQPQPSAQTPPADEPRVKLGDLCARLGFHLSEQFIAETLGIKSAGRERSAIMYRASDWQRLKDALVAYIEGLS